MNNEFDLIARYFSRTAPAGFLGVGDDCALVPIDSGHQLATSTDLLIEGRHFFSDVDPVSLGHKALAVNLSDLAAMGATPLACLLSLSLPAINHDWLAAFSSGFYALADKADCPLVGGDTTRSPDGIIINVTVLGQVRTESALRRSAAKPDDDIWLTGSLGAADIALRLLQQRLPPDPGLLAVARRALEWPQPPWQFAQGLAGLAHAALDISDGLLQDLSHILKASQCGAEIHYDRLPVDDAVRGLDAALVQEAALAGGDVYQLCFTAPAAAAGPVSRLADAHGLKVTKVGRIVSEPGLRVYDDSRRLLSVGQSGFDHFSHFP